ncbi:MAG TPA: ABC transporter ATP-binding protein [Gammaproteobacteria bacterium]|nr:ABC transporter ATP-binding protein [Gammaproteobacteria bacterium]
MLSVRNLSVGFDTDDGYVRVLSDVNLDLFPGETLGLVGESGCGKSITALSIMRLLPQPAGSIESGQIVFNGKDILAQPVSEMYLLRGRRIAMIFQEPMTALNPVQKIGNQLAEVYELHFPDMDRVAIRKACLEQLHKVGIPAAAQRMEEYPHQLSGGMSQRVMIAMALACKPDILIADEPTTALDVTMQAQILDLIKGLQSEMGMSVIFITHDLGVVAQICDRVAVMYAGRIIEKSPLRQLFELPRHPYTLGLLQAIPALAGGAKTELKTIKGTVPSLRNLPGGCRFRDRCNWAIPQCADADPELFVVDEDHVAACIRWHELYDD